MNFAETALHQAVRERNYHSLFVLKIGKVSFRVKGHYSSTPSCIRLEFARILFNLDLVFLSVPSAALVFAWHTDLFVFILARIKISSIDFAWQIEEISRKISER